MTSRRRNLFVILLVLGLLAASVAIIAAKQTRLGLDLKGGVEIVYQGQPTPQSKVTGEAMERAVDQIRKGCEGLGVSEVEVQRLGNDQISVGIPDVKNAGRARRQCGKPGRMFFYDFERNIVGDKNRRIPSLYEATKEAAKQTPVIDDNNTTGKQFYLFKRVNRTLRAGPDSSRKDLLSDLNGRVPKGDEVVVVPEGTIVARAERPDTFPKDKEYNQFYVLRDNPELSGKDIKRPKQEFDQQGTGAPIVTFGFTDKGRNGFHDVTRRLAQRGQAQQIPGQPPDASFQTFAVVLDREVVTRPYINFNENPDGIDGRTGAQISGGFNNVREAQDLAKLLQRGALAINLKRISETQVSATLGKQALRQGLVAGLVGFAAAIVFLLFFYRLLGAIAGVALFTYAILFFALIKLIPITLTLPGIAGLILTIGVAADSNIVIFERIKEELRAGRSALSAISTGYKRGIGTIIDANVVTLITAFILFILATSGVKGFAFTLAVGTLVSLFTAVLFTQAVLGVMGRSRLLRSPAMLGASERHLHWKFDFMGRSKLFFAMSGVILLIGSVAIATKSLNFGIDFKSGTRVTAGLVRPASVEEVRDAVSPLGLSKADIREVSDPELGANAVQIAEQPFDSERVRRVLDERFGVRQDSFSSQSVGPTFGATVARSALYAIIFSLIAIMAYVALRFEPKFAIPVLIALFHDLLITAGIYSLTGREVTTSTVAALLTILGYSLYDTVIVFDRVRENAPRMPRATFSQIVNRSMSEVMTRSLATSLCTLLGVTALLFFGGETLKDFAFALLVGIASGTYSSIFIASPVLTAWKEREAVYVQRRRRVVESFGLVPAFAAAATAGVPATPVSGGGARSEPAPEPDGGPPDDVEPWEPEADEDDEVLEPDDVLDDDVAAAVSEDGHAHTEDVTQPAAQRPAKAAPKKRSRQRRRKHGRRR